MSVSTICSLLCLTFTLLLEYVLLLFLKNIKVHYHKTLILSVLQRGIWILIFLEDASGSFLVSSMNPKNVTRVLHMWIGRMLFRFSFPKRWFTKLQMQLCSEFACEWSTIFTWLVFKTLFYEEFTHRRNQVNPSGVPHSHLSRVSVGNGIFESAVRALLKALNSLGFFTPSLAEYSFLWAILSGRIKIEDNLLSAVLLFWQLWALVFVGRLC